MQQDLLLYLFFLGSILGSISLLLPEKFFPRKLSISYFLSGFAAAAGLITSLEGLIAPKVLSITYSSSIEALKLSFSTSTLSFFFLFIITLITLLSTIYAPRYLTHFTKDQQTSIQFFANFFVIGMAGLVLASNVFTFLFFWELMTLASYFLVINGENNQQAENAGFLYFGMAHLGTVFIFLAFFLLFKFTGTTEFAKLAVLAPSLNPKIKVTVFLLALIGFGTKAGLVPLHIWLPRAHPVAPSHISALMSGVMLKTALYGLYLFAFSFLAPLPKLAGLILIIAGTVSALLGVLYALMEHDLKRLLAYHSVENIGIITLGMGAGVLFNAMSQKELALIAVIASLFHTLNHAVFKSLLFFGAGSVQYGAHTRNIEILGGLIKAMPYTAVFFLVGSIAISALPPFNGFYSEWLTYLSLFGAGIKTSGFLFKIIIFLSIAGLALTGGLAATCFVKAFGITFLAVPRSQKAKDARESSFSMLFSMFVLSLLSLLLGVFGNWVVKILEKPAQFLLNTKTVTSGFSLFTFTFQITNYPTKTTLAMPVVFLLLIITGAVFYVILKALFPQKATKAETWNCGVNLLPAMEYNATSFAKPIRMIFAKLFLPEREIIYENDNPYFPGKIYYHPYITPLFEQFIYRPVKALSLKLYLNAKSLQSGRLHWYLAYIIATIIILLLFV